MRRRLAGMFLIIPAATVGMVMGWCAACQTLTPVGRVSVGDPAGGMSVTEFRNAAKGPIRIHSEAPTPRGLQTADLELLPDSTVRLYLYAISLSAPPETRVYTMAHQPWGADDAQFKVMLQNPRSTLQEAVDQMYRYVVEVGPDGRAKTKPQEDEPAK